MKRRCLVLLLALAPAGLAAEDWSVDWWHIGGGEMATAGGGWQLSGNIGQWQVNVQGPLASGPWELTGGFWGVAATETDVIFKDRFEG